MYAIRSYYVSQVNQGYASLTPVKYDLTATDELENLSCKIEKIELHISKQSSSTSYNHALLLINTYIIMA